MFTFAPTAKSFVVLAIHDDATLEIPSRKTDAEIILGRERFATVTNRETIYEIEIDDAYTANSKNPDGNSPFRRHSTKLFSSTLLFLVSSCKRPEIFNNNTMAYTAGLASWQRRNLRRCFVRREKRN